MIITDEKALRVKCEDVLPDEIDSIRDKLEAALKRSEGLGKPGLGLAAPQIGISKRMAIIRLLTTSGTRYNIDLVNCKIDKGFNEAVFENEACLSFPGQSVNTRRFQEIYVVDNAVEPHSFIATGLLSVVIAHELDHLRGILLPDLAI